MCWGCNERIERVKPWLFQRRARVAGDTTHDWSHTLVSSAPAPAEDSGGGETLNVEARLARLEAKFDAQMAQLITSFESILKQALGGSDSMVSLCTYLPFLFSGLTRCGCHADIKIAR